MRCGLSIAILSSAPLAQTSNQMSANSHKPTRSAPARRGGAKPTVAEAEKFIADAEQKLLALNLKASRASWVQSNFITDDTEAMAASAADELTAVTTELAMQARRYEGLPLSADAARKLKL